MTKQIPSAIVTVYQMKSYPKMSGRKLMQMKLNTMLLHALIVIAYGVHFVENR